MIRNFNYTGRKKIEHMGQNPEVVITLFYDVKNDIYEFDTKLSLLKRDILDKAHVVIEALYNTSYERFLCGNFLENDNTSKRIRLQEIKHPNVHFRVKITDQVGKILARSALIKPQVIEENLPEGRNEENAQDEKSSSSSMFIVQEKKMECIWQVETRTNKKPVLYLNKDMKIKENLGHNKLLQANIFPAVHRELATRYIATHSFEQNDDMYTNIVRLYLEQFVEDDIPNKYDFSLDDRIAYDWIERLVASYIRRMNLNDGVFAGGDQ